MQMCFLKKASACLCLAAMLVGGMGTAEAGEQEERVMDWKHMEIRDFPMIQEDSGGTLLFSDSPEYVRENGILYSDVVSGRVRLYYYHVNDTKKPKQIVALAENVTGKFNTIEIQQGVISGPSDDYCKVGKGSQELYYGRPQTDTEFFVSRKTKLLDSRMAERIVKKDELICGIYDFTAEQPVRISVLAYPEGTDPVEFLKKAESHKKDHVMLRGTYREAERTLRAEHPYDPAKDGTAGFLLADGVVDVFKTGVDAMDGSQVTDVGNYGVNYHIDIPTTGEGRFRCYLRPMGGAYAGFMTVRADNAPAVHHPVPSATLVFGDEESRKEGAAEEEYLGAFEAGQHLHVEFSPPGASNLPVQIVFVPEE